MTEAANPTDGDGAMTTQLDLALAERDRGVARVKAKNSDWVETMRGVARILARRKPDRIVTADDLREWIKSHLEIGEPTHYNAYGAVFSSGGSRHHENKHAIHV